MINRADYAVIAGWVREGARVLDLGCGDGGLLQYLGEARQVQGYGVDIADEHILSCVDKGVNVLQMNLEDGLSGFEDASFDCVILSQTLQTMKHVEKVVAEMLRVGREAIVTLPNFGYWVNRWQLSQGRMPVTKDLPYQWHDTPNVHFCTLDDFDVFCAERGVAVREKLCLKDGRPVRLLPNLLSNLAIYRLARR